MRQQMPRSKVTWRYLPRGTRKHAVVTMHGGSGHGAFAVCGVSPAPLFPRSEEWRGTGRQSEYDTVARLPECANCAAKLTPDTGGAA